MKYLVVLLVLFSFLHSDEIQRIESIVEDITKLRADYDRCQESLSSKKILKTEIVQYKKADNNSDKMIKKYQKLLKAKDSELIALKKEILVYKKKSLQEKKALPKIVCIEPEDDNVFPKLMPKTDGEVKISGKVKTFKARAFCLKIDSPIYNAPNGKKVDEWVKSTSFTSNKKRNKWIKITGYFVDKVWQKSRKNIWIEESKVIKK